MVRATIDGAFMAIKGGWRPTFVVVDEAHHVGEDGMFRRLLEDLGDHVSRVGLTATPWRGDRYDVCDAFGRAVFKSGMRLVPEATAGIVQAVQDWLLR